MTSIITYKEMKKLYEEFKQNLPVDKFDRYYKEFSYMNELIDFAKMENLEDELYQYEIIRENSIKMLKQMGYKLIKV